MGKSADEFKYVPATALERADRIATRANRLLKLVQLKAPGIVIESARQLVLEAALDFPVNEEAREAWRESKVMLQNDEQQHLMKTGYYDDVLKQLDGGTTT